MRKRLLATMLTAAICFGMIGCAPDNSVEGLGSDSKEKSVPSMFVAIEYNSLNGVVCYQKDTKVMYWVSRGTSSYGHLTMLVNPDGSPMVYGEDYCEER